MRSSIFASAVRGSSSSKILVRRLEIVAQEESRSARGALGGRGPAVQVGSPAVFEEAEKVAAHAIDGGRLEHRLDGLGDGRHALFDLGRERDAGIGDAERRQE